MAADEERKSMNKLSKGIVLISAAALTLGLAACGSSTNSDAGHVYFLNNKPEVVDQWNELADMYTKETGVQVDIQSATSGSYESTLSSELAKNNAPTMFGIGGFDQYAKYKNYLEPLQDSEAYKLLNEQGKQMAHKDGDDVYGLPYAAEWFGIIANKKIINEYAKKSYSVIKSFDDIKDFATLKTVADEIQEHKDDMGVKGAFTSAGMDSSAFRYNFHLPSLPLFYEYRDDGVDMNSVPESVKGTYVDYMQNIYDLYITDATVPASSLSGKTMDDATSEFALGEAVFFQDGVWIYSALQDQGFPDEDLGVLPIYMGVDGEEKQGLNQVISNYWCVNSKSSQKDQEATQQFLEWLVTSDAARESISQDMGLVTPFKTFDEEAYTVKNPLVEANREYQENGYYDVISVSTVSHQWEKDLGSAELNYAQGQGDWDAVKKVFTDDWAKEYKLAFAK